MVTEDAFASMLFSTSSAIAFNGLLCDKAMMVMAFQSSPILSLPRARSRVLAAAVAMVATCYLKFALACWTSGIHLIFACRGVLPCVSSTSQRGSQILQQTIVGSIYCIYLLP